MIQIPRVNLYRSVSAIDVNKQVSKQRPTFVTDWKSSTAQPIGDNLLVKQTSLDRSTPIKSAADSTVECANATKKSILKDFANETTIHGIRYFAGYNQHLCAQFVWLLIFGTSFAFCCFTLTPQYQSYQRGDVRTSVLSSVRDEIPFPAVTLCNVNTFRRTVIGSNPANLVYLPMFGYGQNLQKAVCGVNTTNQLLSKFNVVDSFHYKIYGVGNFFLVAHDAYQSVISCSINGRDCFDQIANYITDKGWCFTFNPGPEFRIDNSDSEFNNSFLLLASYPPVLGKPIYTRSTGPNTGLEMTLNAMQFEYCDAGGMKERSAGFSLLVHDPSTRALFMLDDSIPLNTGYRTTVVVHLKEFKRSTEHLGRCTSDVKLDFYRKARKYYRQSCLLECLAKFIKSNCQCLPRYVPTDVLIEIRLLNPNLTLPEYTCINPHDGVCQQLAEKNFTEDKPLHDLCPRCEVPCDEASYKVVQAYAQTFPSENTAFMHYAQKYPDYNGTVFKARTKRFENDPLFKKLTEIYQSTFANQGEFRSEKEVRDNILSVRVYLQSLAIEVVLEDPLVTGFELTSQIGGALGLFLGASLLSMFEVVHFLCLFCIEATCHVHKKMTNETAMKRRKSSASAITVIPTSLYYGDRYPKESVKW